MAQLRLANEGSAENSVCSARRLSQYWRRPSRCCQDKSYCQAGGLDRSYCNNWGANKDNGANREKAAGAIRIVEPADALQAISRSFDRGDQTLLHIATSKCERRTSAFPLQRPRSTLAYSFWRALGLQQELYTVHPCRNLRPPVVACWTESVRLR